MLSNLRNCIPLVILATILLSSVAAAPAAPRRAALAMQVEPYFNGHFKFGEWLPLRVTLNNDGPPLRAEVRADTTQSGGQTTYIAPVELPSGARKRITLYAQPPSFARDVRVRLMDGANELAAQSVSVSAERNVNYLIGVIAPRAEPFAVLASLTLKPTGNADPQFQQKFGSSPSRAVKALPIPLSDIPDRPEGLRALDALVISGVDTSELSLDQRRTLQAWVEQGGRLIVGGGAGAARARAGLPDELVKDFRVASNATEAQSLPALGAFAGQDVRVPGPFVVAWPTAGRALIEQDGHALLAEQRVGEGYVTVAALDLAASPFDAWAGASRFWEKLLTPGAAYPLNAPPDVSPRALRASQLSYALQNLPVLELPSINWLTALLAVYILLIGPVNYLVLRRLGKLAWGWLTIPALTLFFSIGTFGYGFSARGGDVIVNKISLVALNPRSAAPVQTYVGIFSPERTSYTVNVSGRALMAPFSPEGNPFSRGGGFAIAPVAEIVQGEPAQARGLQVEQFALQGFQTESPAPDGWRLESSLTLDGDQVKGTLINRTSETIADAVIVSGNRYARLGNLPPGQSQTLDQTLQSANGPPFPFFLFSEFFRNPGPTGPSREAQVRQQVLSSYFNSTGGPAQPPSQPTLIGWMNSSPLEVQVSGARGTTQQMSMVVATLALRYAPGKVHLTPGSVPARLIAAQGEAGPCGSAQQLHVANGGVATIEFQLPDELTTMRVTRMALNISGGGTLPTEVADRNGEWIKLPDLRFGLNELSDPTRFISADGTVRVRAIGEQGFATGCTQFDLDVEGEL